jgi:hypothetical protein
MSVRNFIDYTVLLLIVGLVMLIFPLTNFWGILVLIICVNNLIIYIIIKHDVRESIKEIDLDNKN